MVPVVYAYVGNERAGLYDQSWCLVYMHMWVMSEQGYMISLGACVYAYVGNERGLYDQPWCLCICICG